MDYSFSTPALLFPATSFLMLAYTNRFLTLSQLVRELYDRAKESKHPGDFAQVENFRLRLKITRLLQIFGALSFAVAIIAMFVYPLNRDYSFIIFILSLLFLLISLLLLILELHVSIQAINIQLDDIDDDSND